MKTKNKGKPPKDRNSRAARKGGSNVSTHTMKAESQPLAASAVEEASPAPAVRLNLPSSGASDRGGVEDTTASAPVATPEDNETTRRWATSEAQEAREREHARDNELAAAVFAVQYVLQTVKKGTLDEGYEYPAEILAFAIAGLRRRGVRFDVNNEPGVQQVSSDIDLEEVRRRTLKIAFQEIQAAVRHVKSHHDPYADYISTFDDALWALEIEAWAAHAIEMNYDGVSRFPLVVEVNSVTRELSMPGGDSPPIPGGRLLGGLSFQVAGKVFEGTRTTFVQPAPFATDAHQ